MKAQMFSKNCPRHQDLSSHPKLVKNFNKQVSMNRKCHKHTPLTNLWHRRKRQMTIIGRQETSSNQPSLPQRDDCKTRKNIETYSKHKTHANNGNSKNKTQQPKPLGANQFYWPNHRPEFRCCKNTKLVQLAWRSPVSTQEYNQINKYTEIKQGKGLSTQRVFELKKTSS